LGRIFKQVVKKALEIVQRGMLWGLEAAFRRLSLVSAVSIRGLKLWMMQEMRKRKKWLREKLCNHQSL
jgi:hypothetical protein